MTPVPLFTALLTPVLTVCRGALPTPPEQRPLHRHYRAMGLAGLYTVTSTVTGSAVFMMMVERVQAMETGTVVLAQGASVSDPSLDVQAFDQLEEAQQRLLQNLVPDTADDEASPSARLDQEFELYRLGPGDAIFVNIQEFPEVSFQATLDLQGNIIVPLAGIMPLQGLSLAQARIAIQQQLNRYLVDPTVSLTLIAQRSVQVTVLGEVVRPGLYPLGNPQLSFALLNAGGATGLANLKTIQVRRTVRDQIGNVVDVVEQNVDFFTPLASGQVLPDLQLADGDVIIVPALTPAETEQYDRTLIARSNLSQPTINVRVLNHPRGISNLALNNGNDFLDAITAISPDLASSNLRDVALIRFNPETGTVTRTELNARDALTGDFSQNPILQDNDVIVIGRNLIARITYVLNNFTQPFRDILGFLLFFDTIGSTADTLFRPDTNDDDDN